jgi:DNA-directed RNA polymerase subunit K/omega
LRHDGQRGIMPLLVETTILRRLPLNSKYLDAARQRIPSVEELINAVSQRARQLMAGARPLVEVDDLSMDFAAIALKEIAEGKVYLEGERDEEGKKKKKKK